MTAQAGSITSNWQAERRELRARMRAARRALSPGQRMHADRRIVSHVRSLPEFRSARRIAVFLAFDGEPSLKDLISAAAARGKRIYAPVLTGARMHFAELDVRGGLATNFFGILEPRVGGAIAARELDLVLTPLVAFDDHGVRVGVGRGYYDRCFGFLLHRPRWRRPKLVGVAYELQRVTGLPRQAWDVPLSAAVTEAGVRRFGATEP